MHHCAFHPLRPATWRCDACARSYCDDCIGDGPANGDRDSCLLCDADLVSLGHAFTAQPFWRRLQESFRYPLAAPALGVIVGTALVGGLAPQLGLIGALVALAATGVLLKYAFTCLKRTSEGELVAPDVAEAWSGGVALLFKLIAIGVVFAIGVGAAFAALGPGMGMLLASLGLLALPAVVIVLALSGRLFTALNPAMSVRIIRAVGLPYGLLQAFILVMTGSVGLIQEVLGGAGPLAQLLQSMVSNYYTIVVFHIMGYMLFQYQGALGFVARGDAGEGRAYKDRAALLRARLDVLVKDGRYGAARALYAEALARDPDDRALARRHLDFLLALASAFDDADGLARDASVHLRRMLRQRHPEPLAPVYHRVREHLPGFVPEAPEVRVAVAKELADRGEYRAAVGLLNGLQRAFPDFDGLGAACHLMADCLEQIPALAAQAPRARALADRFGALDVAETPVDDPQRSPDG